MQQLFYQCGRRYLPCGVVRLAEKHHVCFRRYSVDKGIRHCKIVGGIQRKPRNFTADRIQRRRVLGKGGRRQQGAARADSQSKAEDQIRRAVAAQQPIGGHILGHGQLGPQFPAKGVWVAVRRGQCRRDGRRHPRRQPQRADVGRKSSASRPNSAR